jgi:nicotinamidase-related amidase
VTPPGWLAVVDLQRVFADPGSPWAAPRFAEIRPRVRRLAEAFDGRVVFTRFVAPEAPAGAWREYYERYPFALQPPDSAIYEIVEDTDSAQVLDATTFGKWGPDLAGIVGAGPLTVAGAATDCCVCWPPCCRPPTPACRCGWSPMPAPAPATTTTTARCG